ncbi:cyclic nucleotide-binding-like protein [Chytriomyces sp. MP71]|nr:cyclic nucleotide-binding-like protein [Chytriomyces sp. MP71]
MEELIDYVKWKKLDIETRNKLVAYYETKYRGKYFEEDALLSDMNESLREQIACHNTRRLIENVNFLLRDERDGRDDIYYNKLALKLHACYFVPGDFVMKQGDSGTDMYFISTGRVNVYVNGIKVASLNDAAYFGEKSMVSKAKRMGTIQVVAPSVLYRLTRGDFLDVINEFPDMKARFQSIEEEMGKTDYMKRKLSRFEGNLFSKSRVNNQDSV